MIFDSALTIVGILLLIGAVSCKLSSRFNLPTLLFFLGAGAVAEYCLPFEGTAFVQPINHFGIIAMAYILYSGGMETDMKTIKAVSWRGLMLAVPGVALTALVTGIGAYCIFGGSHNFLWCLLLGALISSTDAAAVFSILRGRSIGLKGDLQPLLELESGSNDPMAAFLTVMLCSLCTGTGRLNLLADLPLMVYGLGGGVLMGCLFGWAGKYLFRIRLEFEGLYFVISVALVLFCYGMAQLFKTNGFMACYAFGVMMGDAKYNYKHGLIKFHNAISWLMQVGLFILLGFLAEPEKMFRSDIWLPGVFLAFLLMFVARPLAVFTSLSASRYHFREKLLISWVGIRGAAPIVLATFPLAMGVDDAALMFRLIFFMVILSVIVQGSSLMPVARLLRMSCPAVNRRERAPLELEIMDEHCDQALKEFEVQPKSELVGRTLADIAMPKGVLVTMIRREGKFVPANGNSTVLAGDGLLIMAEHDMLKAIEKRYFT